MVHGVPDDTEPTSFEDAILGPESKEWIEAIQTEVRSLEEKKTWNERLKTWKNSCCYSF
jgi:hypothetical protein